MHFFLFWVYNVLFVPLFFIFARIAGLFNSKIARGIKGRRHLFRDLRETVSVISAGNRRIWIHISSMGEFEQAKPVIREIKARDTNTAVIISFFSPSGYENARQYSEADVICYLPIDSYWHTKKFIQIVNPDAALVTRHDIWPNFQWRLRKNGIPSILYDASISEKRVRCYKLFAPFIRQVYNTFTQIHAISAENACLLQMVYSYPEKIRVTGDTRYDQVCQRTLEKSKIEPLQRSGRFLHEKCFVAGSTWPSDEKIILPAVSEIFKKHSDFSLIIVPHEITPDHLASIEDHFSRYLIPLMRMSDFNAEITKQFKVLLVDRVGLLANLYGLGQIAFVGGGFGTGVHNVLEPAAHGSAILFGPRHLNSPEAVRMLGLQGARVVRTSEEMIANLHGFLTDVDCAQNSGAIAKKMVSDNLGASRRTVHEVSRLIT